MTEDYDPHLGLSPEDRAIVEALDPDRLSHFVLYDDKSKTVETWARHLDTDRAYRTRVRPMCEMEIEFANARLEGRSPIIPKDY